MSAYEQQLIARYHQRRSAERGPRGPPGQDREGRQAPHRARHRDRRGGSPAVRPHVRPGDRLRRDGAAATADRPPSSRRPRAMSSCGRRTCADPTKPAERTKGQPTMVVEEPTFRLELDPGWVAIAEPVDEGTTEPSAAASRRDARPRDRPGRGERVDDVSGHASGAPRSTSCSPSVATSRATPSVCGSRTPQDAAADAHPPRRRRTARRGPHGRFHRRGESVGRPAQRDRSRRPGGARRGAGPLDGQPRVEGRSALPTS